MNATRNKYIVIFFLITLAVKGCGIFDTRDPESPQTIRSTFYPPTSADIVIDNLTFSQQEKKAENYYKCISVDDFLFIPDSNAQQEYPEIFNGWNIQAERHYLENLIAAQEGGSSTSVLFLDNERLTQITSDSARYQADYIFVFQHNRANVPKSAKGRISVILSTDPDALFYIKRWEDFRQSDTDFTWSEFKANFSN